MPPVGTFSHRLLDGVKNRVGKSFLDTVCLKSYRVAYAVPSAPRGRCFAQHMLTADGGSARQDYGNVASPDLVQEGDSGTLIAVKAYPKTPLSQKSCVAVYREVNEENGFVLTASFTRRPASWRRVVWKP